jgi:hypothetical protein
VVVAEVCGSSLAGRLMVLRGRRAGKGRTRAGTPAACGRPARNRRCAMACGHPGPADSHDKPGRVSKQALRVCEPVVVVTHRISSGLLVVFVVVVGPGGVLVVEGAGFEAAVQDADESVAELA